MCVLTLADGPVGLQEVGFEVDLKQVASDPLDCVINRQNMNPLPILYIRTRLDTVAGERETLISICIGNIIYISNGIGHIHMISR